MMSFKYVAIQPQFSKWTPQFPVRDGLRGPAQFVNLEAELTDLPILHRYFVDDADRTSAVVHDPRNDLKKLRQR